MNRIAVIGAGFSGAVVAHELAAAGYRVDVFEARNHVAGNCHTRRDDTTGVMVQVYGAHIFHTDNDRVWNYVGRFGEFVPYIHRVKATAGGQVYSLPINLHTINQFFGKTYSPDEARRFIGEVGDASITNPQTFEQQALRFVGRDLYEAFFRSYTIKQWGRDPSDLPASILKRLPIRFDYNDNYFEHTYQGLPRHGYTDVVTRMLDHPNISVQLGVRANSEIAEWYDHTFYSGPLDAWFEHASGRLSYRTLDFISETRVGDAQGCPVMNYCDLSVPFTRRIEYKHLTPWATHSLSALCCEYSREAAPDDEPYYPIRLAKDKAQLADYTKRVAVERNVTFIGRLGTYRYLDMDVTISEALVAADKFLGR